MMVISMLVNGDDNGGDDGNTMTLNMLIVTMVRRRPSSRN